MPGLSVTLWTCGGCGKPRGWHHVCARRKTRRDRIAPRVNVTRKCPSCGKQALNPLTHTCTVQSDWKKRKAAQKRAERTAERQRRRRAAAARKRARARERKRVAAAKRKQLRAEAAAAAKARQRARSHDRQRHDYASCRDPHCDKYACRIYREGIDEGRIEGQVEGFNEGLAEGLKQGFDEGFAEGLKQGAA